MKKLIYILGAAAIAVAMPLLAPGAGAVDQAKMDHSKMRHGGAASPATQAYRKAMDGMMAGMDIAYTGNSDVDFAKGMIPHHQGAVEMAKVELEFGKDPELRKLAEDIIKAQESEIAFMTEWMKKTLPK